MCGHFASVDRSSVGWWCTRVVMSQLSGGDCNDHNDAKYDDNNQVDGQHDLLETMTLHTHIQAHMQTARQTHRHTSTDTQKHPHTHRHIQAYIYYYYYYYNCFTALWILFGTTG